VKQEPIGVGLLAQTACLWEATARKPGNVHPHASFAQTGYMDFLLSAAAIQFPLTVTFGSSVGEIVHLATKVTRSVVASNTNLGIILLLAPLVADAHDGPGFRRRVQKVVASLTVEDAALVYEAIRLANPGGLGDSPEQDVHSEPTVTLLEAMKLAADRDMIARQYANGFADIFDFGVPALMDAFVKFGNVEAATVDCQLRWLAEFPDSLIVRKRGLAAAEDVRTRVREVLHLGGLASTEGRRAGNDLDRYLRSDGNKLNPGTTADLVTACLFVALRENKVQPSSPFRWDAPDWLAP